VQLKSPPRGPSWLPAVALLLLVLGAESFLRYSAIPPAKVIAVSTLALGIAVLGWPSSSWRAFAIKPLAILCFVGYMVQAAWRFRGLLKAPHPYDLAEVGFFGFKVLIAVLVLSTVSAGLIRLGGLAALLVARGRAPKSHGSWG